MKPIKDKKKYLLSVDMELFISFKDYTESEYKNVNVKITELIYDYVKECQKKNT